MKFLMYMIFQDKIKKPEPGIRSINLDGKKGGAVEVATVQVLTHLIGDLVLVLCNL